MFFKGLVKSILLCRIGVRRLLFSCWEETGKLEPKLNPPPPILPIPGETVWLAVPKAVPNPLEGLKLPLLLGFLGLNKIGLFVVVVGGIDRLVAIPVVPVAKGMSLFVGFEVLRLLAWDGELLLYLSVIIGVLPDVT